MHFYAYIMRHPLVWGPKKDPRFDHHPYGNPEHIYSIGTGSLAIGAPGPIIPVEPTAST